MNHTMDHEIIQSLLTEINGFPPDRSYWIHDEKILEEGFYFEGGLRFEKEVLENGQIYAGLSVLTRDMYSYLKSHPQDDATLIEDIVHQVFAEETYGDQSFPKYVGLPYETLPTQFASVAAAGQPNITDLGSRDIVHEWTVKPGKRLFLKFRAKFKETICGKNGPYEMFQDNLGQSDLPKKIVEAILLSGVISPATFWYPLAVYIAILLVKTGLKTYCEE